MKKMCKIILILYFCLGTSLILATPKEAEQYIKDFYKDFPPIPGHIKREVEFKPPTDLPTIHDPVLNIKRRAHGMTKINYPIIFLNTKVWKHLNSWQRKELVYHEMAHSVLGMYHPVGYKDPNFKDQEDIMYPFNGWRVKEDGSNWELLVWRLKRDYVDKRANQKAN